ncbi:MAG: pitrilysin family protein [Eubacteriales bacterium]|nr:pitrilysin family protein [Eubacteriales bacterium]
MVTQVEICEKQSSRTGEKYTKILFDNGLTAFIIHKNHTSAYATLAVNFGSCDTKYASADGKIKSFPPGTAHFLEHRMFETKEGDAMERYALFGGDANAYTAGDRTCYYYISSDMFYENLRVLIDHVTNAHITKKSVEKEKAVIIQEIKMYDDNPYWVVRYNMMKCLYGESPISEDPAGSVESVKNISREILEDCRRTVYNLHNMALCVCGNIETDSFIAQVNDLFSAAPEAEYWRVDDIPDAKIVSAYFQEHMDVSLPVYSVGIKLCAPSETEGTKEFAAVEIIMNLLFGKSAAFYSENYEAGIFERLSCGYQTMRKAFFAEIYGSARNPAVLFDKVKEHIKKVKAVGFDARDFETAKKSLYADTICEYDSVENIADTFVSYYFENDDMFDYPDIVANITLEYTEECLKRLFDCDNICLSVILPKKEEHS